MESFNKLKQIIAGIEDDLAKAIGGNKAAGVRVRQSMQEVKNAAQDVRAAILTLRGPEAEKKPEAGKQ
ncbi:MAG: histone H1 [Phycisphaerales bacterium]